MTAVIIPFPGTDAGDPLAPFEDELMDAAEGLATAALNHTYAILGPEFDVNLEAQGLLRAALGLLVFEQGDETA